MLPPNLQSPREVTLYYDSLYFSLIRSGEARPFLYPWSGIAAFAVLGYLLLDHRQSPRLRSLRYPLFAFLFAFQAWCIATNRAKHPAAAFGVGLLSSWGVLWIAALMIMNDCQADFKRIDVVNDGTQPRRLRWAPYPSKFGERLDWVADVFCSFRGVGWNWQISGIPPAPKSVEAQLRGDAEADSAIARPEEFTISKTGIRRFGDRSALLKDSIVRLAVAYVALDVIKTLMHRDPYFWGYTDATPPAYLPMLVRTSPVLTRSYRLLLALAGVYAALHAVFKLGPVFFCGLLGPKWIGVRGEAWMNPVDMFGDFTSVLDRGLAGWWAGWWHQVFRFGFEAPTTRLLRTLRLEPRSSRGKAVGLATAFFLSGCLHACGSYTQLGDTRPLMGPMRFFLLQAVGIAAQDAAARGLSAAGLMPRGPAWWKRVANFVLVHVWLYYTAPLLMDDFSQGGVWLFEPVAISPLRALGLGAKDDTWWCWWNGIVFWHQGEHFWDSGLAL